MTLLPLLALLVASTPRIAFYSDSSTHDRAPGRWYVMDVDGSNREVLDPERFVRVATPHTSHGYESITDDVRYPSAAKPRLCMLERPARMPGDGYRRKLESEALRFYETRGTKPRRVAIGGLFVSHPALSRDRELVAVVVRSEAGTRLTVLDWSGTVRASLDATVGPGTALEWSPNGAWISCVARRSVEDLDIVAVRVDGGDTRKLSTELDVDQVELEWSPNCEWIACRSVGPYVARGGGPGGGPYTEPRQARLSSFSIRIATGERHELPQLPLEFVWSSDSSKLAFSLFDGTRAEFKVVLADGSGERTLLRNICVSSFAWSPDGMHIAARSFQEAKDGTRPVGIFVIPLDGSAVRDLSAARVRDHVPHWVVAK